MKKILLFAASALSVVACTNEDIIEDVTSGTSKGITFEISNPETRGELTDSWNFFWYAEKDQINIYTTNKSAVKDNAGNTGDALTIGIQSAPAVYKATRSQANGLFTSIDAANMLTFNGVKKDTKTNFIGTYPTTVKVSGWAADGSGNLTSVGVSVTSSNITQNLKFDEVIAPMVAYSNAITRDEYYESVGEKVNLKPNRPFPVIRLSSTENNEKYNTYLGKLQNVTIKTTMKNIPTGYAATDLDLAATSASFTYENGADGKIGSIKNLVKTGETNTITVNIKDEDGVTSNAYWKKDDQINITVLPLEAKVKKGDDVKNHPITYTMTYTYEHATLIDERTQSSAANVEGAHTVYEFSAWDIASKYNYIVTNDYKLLIFGGTFNAIFDKDGNIKWNNSVVAPSAITAIYSEVALTPAEQDKIKNFTGVTSINLPNQTSIAKDDVFQNCGDVTELILPKVTSYKDTKTTFNKLITLDLGSYDFMQPNEDVATKFFNDDVKTSLVTLDIHSVKSLSPAFGYERNILFTDYAALETIKLSNEGTVISANEFSGCTNLKTVEGVVDMTTAVAAFNGASTAVALDKQPTINVATTVIPADAFMNSSISDIKFNGSTIVPTQIGKRAFAYNNGIESLDLSLATEIGTSAFYDAVKFIGAKKVNGVIQNNGVVTLNVSTVEEYAFDGTKVARFQLKNATTVKANGLASDALKQIKFRQNVSKWNAETKTGIAPSIVVNPTSVDLFIKAAIDQSAFDQTYRTITVDDTDWTTN